MNQDKNNISKPHEDTGRPAGTSNSCSTGGGFGMQTKKSKVYMVYPNGSASGTKGFLFFRNYPKVMPGFEIIVPLKGMPPQMSISMGSAMASIGLTIVTIANMNRN